VMSDTPTTNWCTLNPNDSFLQTVSNGNLVSSNTNNVSTPGIRASMAMSSGKWYWEITCGVFTTSSTWMIGVADSYQKISIANYTSSSSYLYYSGNGQKYNGSGTSYGATYTTGDVIGVAYDADNGKIWFAKNNTWQNSGDPAAGTGEAYSGITGDKSPYVGTGLYQVESIWNFGQRAFAYTPPTGFNALNTANLPAPDIADGSDYFNTVLWTGNGSTQSITGVGFQPDFVWSKTRSPSGYGHWLGDVVRGGNERLASDSTQEGRTNEGNITFDTDGFSVTSTHPSLNNNTSPIVAWNWLAGGSVSADNNTDGSITSTVSANPSAGFSIVSFNSGPSGSKTVGHGLGVALQMIITKDRDNATNWTTYHASATTATDKYLNLNGTAAVQTASGIWGATLPTSTVFGFGSGTASAPNANVIAYCFTEVEGYSKFGSYTGNGTTTGDGPFVFCGFKPRWIVIKNATLSGGNWRLIDTARESYNVGWMDLYANDATGETAHTAGTTNQIDILSNGFKIRDGLNETNRLNDNLIFAAFAENPFGGSGVSPATAR